MFFLDTTSATLLDRLKVPEPDDADWRLLHEVYYPLVFRWINLAPGIGEESADIAQDVFMVLTRELPDFQRQRNGSFRSWLKKITINRIRSHRRKSVRSKGVGGEEMQRFLNEFADPQSPLSRRWSREHDQNVLEKLLVIVGTDFGETAWNSFQLFALQGLPATEVAEKTGLSVNAVIKTKARILSRLRAESRNFLE